MIDPFAIRFLVLAVIVLYVLVGRTYQDHLKETYGYRLLGIPFLVAIAGAAISSLFPDFGIAVIESAEPSTFEIVKRMLIFETPGVALAVINCFGKTRSLLHCVLSALILYVVSFVAGVYAVMAVMAAIAIFIFSGGIKEMGRTAQSRVVKVDENGKEIY